MLARAEKRRLFDLNWIVFVVIVIIIAIGLLNLRNADFYSEDSFHERQLKWYLVGVVLAVIVAITDLHIISRLSYLGYAITSVMLFATLFTEPINNSRRWLPMPGFGDAVQPSEFAKLTLILALARFFHDGHREEKPDDSPFVRFLRPLFPFALILPPVALIFLEPDLGTALIVLFVALSIVFFEGLRWRTVFTAISLVAIIVPLGWRFFMHDYQKDRVRVWLDSHALEEKYDSARKALKADPDNIEIQKKTKEIKEILDKAYQPKQAEIAIGSGGFYGKGGQQGHADRQRTLPYLHTDFVIACYGEERGFIGCTVLLVLYYLLCYWALRVTKIARDRYQVLLCVGASSLVFWQFFVNVGMVTGLLPVVGVTLPLLSYGGSSVLTIFTSLGLVFNIMFRKRATG